MFNNRTVIHRHQHNQQPNNQLDDSAPTAAHQ